MSLCRKSVRYNGTSGLRRLIAVLSLLLFVAATVIHFPGLDTTDAPPLVSAMASDFDDADGKALTADHCHCVVAAPWPASTTAAKRSVLHDIPTAPAHALATHHLKNDGPPPKA